MYNFICFYLAVIDNLLLLLLFLVYNTVIFLVSLLYANKDIHKYIIFNVNHISCPIIACQVVINLLLYLYFICTLS